MALAHNTKCFNVCPQSKFDVEFPYFRKPIEIGCFSQDSERKVVLTRQQMKFYVVPTNPDNVAFDLRIGYRDFIRKDETRPDLLDDLLKWILKTPSVFTVQSNTNDTGTDLENKSDIHTDFVCWRGLITRLMCTPFETNDGWKIAVVRFQNTYFLCEFDTEKKAEYKKNKCDRDDEMCYWGWKFEQYVTACTSSGRPDTHSPVNNNEAFCTVVRSRLNSHSLVYGGEVDAALSDQPADQYEYVEFKTSVIIESQRQDYSFRRYKLIKWWAQSFLVGITQIVAGFRDRDGVVRRLDTLNTRDIPNMVKQLRDHWKPNICFNFLDQILTFIKTSITVNDPSVVYLLEWQPGCDVTFQRLAPNSQYSFLPQWYTNPSTEAQKDDTT